MQKVWRFFGALRIVHYLFIMGKILLPMRLSRLHEELFIYACLTWGLIVGLRISSSISAAAACASWIACA